MIVIYPAIAHALDGALRLPLASTCTSCPATATIPGAKPTQADQQPGGDKGHIDTWPQAVPGGSRPSGNTHAGRIAMRNSSRNIGQSLPNTTATQPKGRVPCRCIR